MAFPKILRRSEDTKGTMAPQKVLRTFEKQAPGINLNKKEFLTKHSGLGSKMTPSFKSPIPVL